MDLDRTETLPGSEPIKDSQPSVRDKEKVKRIKQQAPCDEDLVGRSPSPDWSEDMGHWYASDWEAAREAEVVFQFLALQNSGESGA